ncbi:MAG: hypothetical protein IH987_08825, partial [Planctomycetes bacterium]|nr:hypothetical protein [Planctomycetota bacterium]
MNTHEESKSEVRHQRNGFVRTFGLVPTVFVLAAVVLLLWQPITAAPTGESVRAVKTAAVASQAIAMTAVGTPATQPPLSVQRPKKDAAPEVTDVASRGGGGGSPCVDGQACTTDADCGTGTCDPLVGCICKCIPPGDDCFTTVCNGRTFMNFGVAPLPPIPAGYFFPGSPQFIGQVFLRGAGGFPGDTIVRRLDTICFDCPLPQTRVIPTEMVQLNLISCTCISVGGRLFLARVSLAG